MGFFVDNPSRGSFLNSQRSNSPLTVEQFFNLPFNNFFPKFYELIPAKVTSTDYTTGDGRITVDKLIQNDDGSDTVEAFPANSFMKTFPQIGDVVFLIEYDLNLVDNKSEMLDIMRRKNNVFSSDENKIYYYIDINTALEPKSYKNLYPIPGDVIFQGRHGQSIRFSTSLIRGTHDSNTTVEEKLALKNNWIYGETHGTPLIIISNGRRLYDQNITDVVEDINLDSSSIYLTTDNTIPLKITQTPSEFLNEKFSKNPPRDKFGGNSFSGKQIISVSDNLIFKSRNNTCLFSDANITFNSTNSIVLTSGGSIVLEPMNNSFIYLGKSAVQNGEPAVKAETLIKILRDVLTTLEENFKHIDSIKVKNALTLAKSDLEKIKSRNTYIL